MRSAAILAATGSALALASPAFAEETLKYGGVPSWVVPQSIPNPKATDAPVAMLLQDQQIALEPGKIVTYAELAFRIQNPQGLAAGNLSISWNPSTDSVTVNKLQIRRGDKVIDVLGSGQTFTVLRRETNLDLAMLDGTLTGNIQPEGLQEGDIIDLATTTEQADPVFKGHVEAIYAAWNGLPLELGHVAIAWPSALKVQTRVSAGVPAGRKTMRGGSSVLEVSSAKIQPLIIPKGAPGRFSIGRIGEATDYQSWADVANLMIPLYEKAAVIPASGPLHDEVERIRAASTDPARRAEQALALVQDRIRYVALTMGQGGYVPADAETSWSRRFGDCKAKTALLLGILRSLGIAAEPVIVNSNLGDAIADRLPMVGVFDHVLVRAHINGKEYWLDGTRTGDTSIDRIEVPNFGWVLPLVKNASLTHIQPSPLEQPDAETFVTIDGSKGVRAPSPATVEQTFRGDAAIAFNTALLSLTAAQRDEFFKAYWKKVVDLVTPGPTAFTFDKAKQELRYSMHGEARLEWTGGYFHVPNSGVGFEPDFDRPAGPTQDAPFSVGYPSYSRTVTKLKVPDSLIAGRHFGSAPVHETLAGVEYSRSATLAGNMLTVETVERSLVPEVPYKEARAAEARLRALSDEDVALPMPSSYRATTADLAALEKDEPASAQAYIDRGLERMNAGELDGAVADFTKAKGMDSSNVWAIADRAVAYVWKRDFASAEKDLSAAEKIDPTNAVVNRARGLMAEVRGDFKAAVDAYSKSLAGEPNNSFALGHRSLAERALGNDDAALADAELALKANSAWTELRLMRANILVSRGNRNAVAAEADLIVRDNPQSDYALVAAGKIYARVGMQAKAMGAFDRALAIKPEAYIYLNRAQARPASDHAGRVSDLETALKLKPDDVDTMAEVARAYADLGDIKKALALYDRLVVPSPGFSEYDVQRAAVLHKAGRTAEAERILAAERKKAKTPTDFNNLCWAKATAGVMLESALQDCREALKRKPDNGPYLDSLGMVLLKLGKLDEALGAYNQAVAKRTGADSLMGRAMVYARKGDHSHANADAVAARRLYPEIDADFAKYGLKFDDGAGSIAADAH